MQPEYKSPKKKKKKIHPILSLPLLTLSTFTPFPLHCSFLRPPLCHNPLSSPSSLPYFCHSSSRFSLGSPFHSPPLPSLTLLLSPPISVPFSVLVQHVKVGYRYAPLCLGANQWKTVWGCCSRLGCWFYELRRRRGKGCCECCGPFCRVEAKSYARDPETLAGLTVDI